jgi:hypothetical protein
MDLIPKALGQYADVWLIYGEVSGIGEDVSFAVCFGGIGI